MHAHMVAIFQHGCSSVYLLLQALQEVTTDE